MALIIVNSPTSWLEIFGGSVLKHLLWHTYCADKMNYRWHQHGRFFHIDTPKTIILLQKPTWVCVMDFLECSPTLEINGQWRHGTLSQFCLKKGTMSAKWITHCWLLENCCFLRHTSSQILLYDGASNIDFKFIMNFLSPKN